MDINKSHSKVKHEAEEEKKNTQSTSYFSGKCNALSPCRQHYCTYQKKAILFIYTGISHLMKNDHSQRYETYRISSSSCKKKKILIDSHENQIRNQRHKPN